MNRVLGITLLTIFLNAQSGTGALLEAGEGHDGVY